MIYLQLILKSMQNNRLTIIQVNKITNWKTNEGNHCFVILFVAFFSEKS